MKRFLRTLLILMVIYTILVNIIGSFKETEEDYAEEIEVAICDEYTTIDSLENELIYTHTRSWDKYSYDSNYCLTYRLTSQDAERSYLNRRELYSNAELYEHYWRDIYLQLHVLDSSRIIFLRDSLEQISIANSFARSDLARLIVSFVQDIPYSYVMPGVCDRTDHPCRGNEKFGILSPVEFLYSLTGDCDTRSVLLYSLLKQLDFDPLIVISNQYRHAMIALDLPATGDYIVHKGKKFYFWETTNTGWLPGMLPPGVNNTAYWKVTLDHEYPTIITGNR